MRAPIRRRRQSFRANGRRAVARRNFWARSDGTTYVNPPQPAGFRAAFIVVDVTAPRLGTLARLVDSRKLTAEVGTVLPLEEARRAHKMLAGAPHKRGKIVITMHGVHEIRRLMHEGAAGIVRENQRW